MRDISKQSLHRLLSMCSVPRIERGAAGRRGLDVTGYADGPRQSRSFAGASALAPAKLTVVTGRNLGPPAGPPFYPVRSFTGHSPSTRRWPRVLPELWSREPARRQVLHRMRDRVGPGVSELWDPGRSRAGILCRVRHRTDRRTSSGSGRSRARPGSSRPSCRTGTHALPIPGANWVPVWIGRGRAVAGGARTSAAR